MQQGKRDGGFRTSDVLWRQMKPLLPAPKPHPLGCHWPRVPTHHKRPSTLTLLQAKDRPIPAIQPARKWTSISRPVSRSARLWRRKPPLFLLCALCFKCYDIRVSEANAYVPSRTDGVGAACVLQEP
jgi:hypothetical protein